MALRTIRYDLPKSALVLNRSIEAFTLLAKEETKALDSIVKKEIVAADNKLRKEKMLLVSDAIGTAGNIIKIFAPPACGNPNAINVAQWFTLIRRGLSVLLFDKDKTAKELYYNREAINQKWKELLKFDYYGEGSI